MNIFLILAAEPAKIKFLKSRKKTIMSNILNFASLYTEKGPLVGQICPIVFFFFSKIN